MGLSPLDGFVYVFGQHQKIPFRNQSAIRERCGALWEVVKRLEQKHQELGLGNGWTEQLGGCNCDFTGSWELHCADRCS